MSDLLSSRKWLAGETTSAADIVYYPTCHRLMRAAGKAIAQEHGLQANPLADYPAVEAWLARMQELPGVDGTYPPHWR